MKYYVIKDTRDERRDGKPQYVYCYYAGQGTYDIKNAESFVSIRDARRAAKVWGKICDYVNPSAWISIVTIHRP